MALNTTDSAGREGSGHPARGPDLFLRRHAARRRRSVAAAAVGAAEAAARLPAAGQPQPVLSGSSARCWSRCATGSSSGKEPPASVYPTIARTVAGAARRRQLPVRAGVEVLDAGRRRRSASISIAVRPFDEVDIAGVMAEPPTGRHGLSGAGSADRRRRQSHRRPAQHRGPGAARHLHRLERAQGRLQRRRFLRPDRRLTFRSSAPRPSARRPRTRGRRWKSAIRRTAPTWRRSAPPRRSLSPNASCCRRTPS